MINLVDVLEKLRELEKLGGLKFMVLHVLDKGPKNGTEIMDSIERHRIQVNKVLNRHSHDENAEEICSSLKPSSGAIYPLLKKLVSKGLIVKREDNKYELTEKGSYTLEKISGHLHHSLNEPMNRGTIMVDTALNEIESYIRFLSDIKPEKLQSKKESISKMSKMLIELEKSLE
ncbi:transcriptional regulator PadR family protein [Methanobacterium lacus]|jgi:DNA-binding PadR family transcriptional regulator|uniref:Transcriptional regulator PadR family protein n=1 Tax=Methanobacterium lacus (strain AL-21) TaxID=877455 RepID=F0TBG4_METLA|nr:PadR family transcriptional regulator [Methanobacterium lacus]ADZ10233.1 transcriptional regulator PadR family protein [Methanobacterium lacus]